MPVLASLARCALLASTLAVAAGAALAAEPAPDPLREEARRRNDALVKEGFNMTRGLSTPGGTVLEDELLVPPSDVDHVLRVWIAAREGEVTLRFGPAGGEPWATWSGGAGEVTLRRPLPPGRYVLALDATRAAGARAVVGVRGPVIGRCAVEGVAVEERPADPARGFRWPYLLAVPEGARAGHLLVVPNSTGFVSEELELLRASASCDVAAHARLAARLGTPLLVPLFPRPGAGGEEDNLYLHALTRAALEARAPEVARVDLQLVAMIDDARARLSAAGRPTSPRVLLSGFSASGSFVHRFALLHPGRVRAVASGSPGGWPTAPAAEDGGERLPYPVGIADVAALTGAPVDLAAARAIAWYFFLGSEDSNDAVPYRDSFSAADEALVKRRFGPTPVARWASAERLWRAARLDARFRLVPGAGHEVTPETRAELERFFARALGR